MKHSVPICLSVVVWLALSAVPADAGLYTFTPVDPPGAGIHVFAEGINNAGVIAGVSFDRGFRTSQSFLDSNGAYTPFSAPGAQPGSTQLFGINNLGQLAGNYTDSGGNQLGFFYDGSTVHTINPPDNQGQLAAIGVNDLGKVAVSYAVDDQDDFASSIYFNGTYSPVAVPDGMNTQAYGINNAGDVVGEYFGVVDTFFSNSLGFLLHAGQYTPIAYPVPNPGLFDDPVYNTIATGISNTGEIIGYFIDETPPFGLPHGFIYQNGQYTTLDNPLGVGGTYLFGVNDQGQIVGSYVGADGFEHGFLATPAIAAPEPASLTLLTAAGLTLAGRRLRKRA